MKIGLVCPYNIFKGGGVQECVIALQRQLTDKGHQALIITPRPNRVPQSNIDGLELVGTAKEIKSPFHTTAQVSVILDPKQLDELLVRHKFDVLHVHEPWVPLLGWQLLSHAQCATVATFHAKLPETAMSKTIEKVIAPYTKAMLKSLTAFTAVSTAAAEYVNTLQKQMPIIVPNGIDLETYQYKKQTARDKDMILYIGRLERRKGVQHLLRAYKVLKNQRPTSRLVIAGDGPDREKLESFAKSQRLADVVFLGHITERKKLQLLKKTTIFCSPALYGESFGIVLLEAMATGAVVVAGDNPGYRSVMQERGSISIVDPKNTTAFVNRLKLLMADESIRALWQEWATLYVKQFDYQVIAQNYLDVYQHALTLQQTQNTFKDTGRRI